MVYHLFNYRIQNTWYRDLYACSDLLFDSIMDKLDWKLPVNMQVYHYGSPGPQRYALSNPVSLKRPILSLDPLALVLAESVHPLFLRDRQRREQYPVRCRIGRFVLCDDESRWPRFYYVDGRFCNLVAPMRIAPVSLQAAQAYVRKYHRHNTAPQGHKFSIGLLADSEYIGVVIASIPKARALNDGMTLEINRVCCDAAYFNACSKLYAAAVKAGRAMGYTRFVTYTLPEEGGGSVKAVGFQYAGRVPAKPEGWNCRGRPRAAPVRYPSGEKVRWILSDR